MYMPPGCMTAARRLPSLLDATDNQLVEAVEGTDASDQVLPPIMMMMIMMMIMVMRMKK